MVEFARVAISQVKVTVDRKPACLAQASACRARAEADPTNRDRWVDESIKWLERAIETKGGLPITFEGKDGQLVLRDAK